VWFTPLLPAAGGAPSAPTLDAPPGWYARELIPQAWFDATTAPNLAGWFDPDMVDVAGAAPAVILKFWNGSAWADAVAVNVWDGAAWAAAQAKVWSGSAWV
jgi:hypothetical protein